MTTVTIRSKCYLFYGFIRLQQPPIECGVIYMWLICGYIILPIRERGGEGVNLLDMGEYNVMGSVSYGRTQWDNQCYIYFLYLTLVLTPPPPVCSKSANR
jgi:hypothetical protein